MMEADERVPINRKLILYGIFLLVVSIGIFYAFTLRKESIRILLGVPFKDVIILMVLWFMYIFFDSLKLSLLSKIGEKSISVLVAFKTIVIGIFLAAVTPFQVSGLPVQIYYLTRFGVGVGEATSFLLLRGVVTFTGILTFALPFSYILRNTFSGIMKGIYMYAMFVIFFITLLYVLIMFSPRFLKRVVKGRTFEEFMILRRVLIEAIKHKEGRLYLLYAFLSTLFSLMLLGVIPYFVEIALGVRLFTLWQSIGYQMIAVSSLLFTPTPGGSGLAEAAGSFIFVKDAGKELIFPFVVLWRFFTFYISALVGAFVFIVESRRMLK